MAARAAAGRDDAAAASAVLPAVAWIRAMVKQGGSETADNDGSKLVNVAHLQAPSSRGVKIKIVLL
jgi:hypothetical protein